ncbi:MAG: hypothetical protein J0L52_11080 [Caulobacterales bacterium]|nr:hypothetical protein [Caulobacterales bacterium]
MKPLIPCTAVMAALALVACEAPGTGTQSADAGATSAGDAGPAASAGTESINARVRAGLWQTTASFPDGNAPSVNSRVCFDETMTALNVGSGQSAPSEDCTQNVTRTSDGFAFTSRCDAGPGGVTETVGTMTGDFQSAYRMEATVTTTGSSMAALNGTTQVVTTAEYQGACPEGWRAGDVEVPGLGTRININDMQAQAAQAGAATGASPGG